MGFNINQRESRSITAAALNLNAKAINAAKTSNAFSTNGFGTLDIFINYTRSTGTAVTFSLEGSNDGGTTWFKPQAESVSAGVSTLTNYTFSNAVSGSEKFVVSSRIFADVMRILSLTATGGDDDDVATVTVRMVT